MKFEKLVLAGIIAISSYSCSEKSKQTDTMDNPLLVKSELPYGTPDFSLIKDEHYLPAMEEAMADQNEKIKAIVENTEEANFDNTILALQKSGKLFDQVRSVFYAMTSANTNDVIKSVQEELSPKVSTHFDNIFLNNVLFEKVKEIYDKRESLELDAESKKLVEDYYADFVQAGANLSDEDKAKLKELNSKLATLQTQFNQTLLDANNASNIAVADKEKLSGVSESHLKSLESDGAYSIKIINTTQQPIMSSLDNRELREQVFNTSWNRADSGDNSTKEIVMELVRLRADKAKLLGYDNYAQWSLNNTMAKDTQTIRTFFDGMIPAINHKATNEANDIKEIMKQDGIENLKPWDWSYYAEKVRKAKYDLDESQIKPYFEVTTVLEKGVFYAAEKLYGITFKKRDDIPVYHEDVNVYEVFEEDGTPMALFYTDFFARDSKRGGAWMSNFVTQSHLYNQKPVIYNVCNYQKPAEGEAALISFDDVTTMFHEFGHALHGLFANQKYPKLSGTAVARDFVEYPSQANEHWALESEVLKNYAIHYQTGEAIPTELIDKIKNASTFNQGFSLTEVMGAADLDLNYHTISDAEAKEIKDPNVFEKDALVKDKLWNEYIPPRYRSTYFAHIFGGGYAAGYYSYLWTEMLAHDTNAWFDENGGLKRELGQKYREMILSQGNTQDYKEMYEKFRGSQPKIDAMIKARGLK